MGSTTAHRRLRLAPLLAFIVLAGLAAAQAAAREVAIGLFAYQGERAAAADWSPVLDYLNRALPEHRFRLDRYDAEGLRRAIAEHRVELVITNPGYYVTMESEFGLSRIATLVSPQAASPARALGSAVFTRADRQDLRDLADLGGTTLAAVAPDAFGGYLVAARELLRLGIDPESDVNRTLFVGLPMQRVVETVQRREADAGIVRACLLEQLASQGAIRLDDFRILSPRREEGLPCALSTPLYPDWPIAVTRRTDPALAKAVARALLAMPEAPGGMSWTVPADYQPVHELYRELHLGPYAYLREITPEGLARRFWPWLLAVLAVMVAWIVHTVRVETQVHRRTAELQESLRAREAAEARIREHQEQMEHLSRLSILGELSGKLAHEINQPLTTIGTYARSVLRRQADGKLTPEAVTEACTEIADEAERAGGIVRRIRHFSRKRAASRDPVDIAFIAEEARRLVTGMLAKAPDIAIDNRTPGGCLVLADGPQIQQVLLNLVKNAVDAGRDLPAERQGIRVVIEPADNRLVVHVIDRGVGLDADQLPHLFEPFFTTKPDGLGLGLPICKTIIEAHGGRLWAEPNPDGPGMRFAFSLPCHEPSA
ncbi:MAG TPA: PhnD/SsuA/transferrin family substrate-binding protein [Rhodocyclaceae bacterium]|nr:PhnD/SsuA/transferrin family substrate-binding protein [Rhodocyclaceae bacterium]